MAVRVYSQHGKAIGQRRARWQVKCRFQAFHLPAPLSVAGEMPFPGVASNDAVTEIALSLVQSLIGGAIYFRWSGQFQRSWEG